MEEKPWGRIPPPRAWIGLKIILHRPIVYWRLIKNCQRTMEIWCFLAELLQLKVPKKVLTWGDVNIFHELHIPVTLLRMHQIIIFTISLTIICSEYHMDIINIPRNIISPLWNYSVLCRDIINSPRRYQDHRKINLPRSRALTGMIMSRFSLNPINTGLFISRCST